MDKISKKKDIGIVVILSVAILLTVIVITIAFASMIKASGGTPKKEDATLYSLSGVTNPTKPTETTMALLIPDITEESAQSSYSVNETIEASTVIVESEEEKTEAQTISQTEAQTQTQTEATTKGEEYNPVSEYEKLSKNGDNILSDHHKNKFIKLISEKYNVDTELLVAIYAEPDKGNNFVLEFSGERDEDGNVIKSPDTLTKVYAIDKDKNISVATGKATGNVGVTYAEGVLCFNMMKTIVMPQYPDYFTGVENPG